MSFADVDMKEGHVVTSASSDDVLDQLGLYDVMREKFMTGMRRTFTRRSDGRVLSSNEWPTMVEER